MALPVRPTRTAPAPVGTTTPHASWLMLAVLLLGQFMCIIDVLVTNVAMPSIAASLHASGASLQLVVRLHDRVRDAADYRRPAR